MADVVLKDSSGAEQTYPDVDEIEIPNTEDGTERFVSERLIQNQVQANWSQTDQTQPDYIRNKPEIIKKSDLASVADTGNYEDLACKPFGEVCVLPETEVRFKASTVGGCYMSVPTNGLRSLDRVVLGEGYTVTWDGVAYTCVAGKLSDFYDAGSDQLYLGNQAQLFGLGLGTDTGEPFILVVQEDNDLLVGFLTDDAASSHTVSVTPVSNIRKIDSKYLPDGLATETYVAQLLAAILPAYSSADNGKVLGIQNGKLAWVTVHTSGSGLTVNADGNTLTLDGDSVTANAEGDTIVITTSLPVSTDGDTIILGGT